MERITFVCKSKRFDVRGENTREIVKKVVEKLEKEMPDNVCNVKLKDWALEWLEVYKKPSIAEETYKSYVDRFNCHLFPTFGNKRLDEITPQMCQKYFNSLAGYSQNTIKKIYNDFRQIMSKAVRLKMLNTSPLLDISLPKGSVGTRRQITPNEEKIILEVSKYHPAGFYLLLMLFCGLRPHETALLQGKDVNGSVLHIRGNKNKASDRYVPIPKIFLPCFPDVGDEEYLVSSLTGITPINKTHRVKMWNSFKAEMKKYGEVKKDLVPYCLRHTYCTKLQDAGVSINVAKEFMGHCSINLTSNIYTHASTVSFRKAEKLINSCHTSATF